MDGDGHIKACLNSHNKNLVKECLPQLIVYSLLAFAARYDDCWVHYQANEYFQKIKVQEY